MADTKRGSILLLLNMLCIVLLAVAGCSKDASKTTAPIVDTIPPSIPDGIAAAVGDGDQVALTWQANTVDSDLQGYVVYRSNELLQGFRPITAQPVTSNSWVDMHTHAGETYYYSVAARDVSHNESGRSATFEVSIPPPPYESTPTEIPTP